MLSTTRLLKQKSVPMKGPDVLLVQQRLTSLGYFPGGIDGVYKYKTTEAVKQFQQDSGLKANGIVGRKTWLKLLKDEELEWPVAPVETLSQPVINVHVDTRILTLVNNQTIRTYPVAVGRPSMPTPPGQWTIVQKALNPGGPFGVRWMRLSVPFGSYGIHGTNNPSSIGKAVSHGCVRMYNNDVIEVYDMVPIGTRVNISGVVRKIRNLKLGSKGADVREVQEMLRDLGYYNKSVDGVYGPATRRAVIRFQKDHGLKADGIVGKITLKALQIAHDLAFS